MCKVSGRNFKGDKIFFTQEVDGLEHAARGDGGNGCINLGHT